MSRTSSGRRCSSSRGRCAARRTSTASRPPRPALLGAVEAYPDYGVKELAAREGISSPAITRNLDRLEEAGLIDRSRSTSDARRITLAVTPKGRTTLRSIRSQRTALLVSMLADLTPDELAQVAEANDALKRIIPEG